MLRFRLFWIFLASFAIASGMAQSALGSTWLKKAIAISLCSTLSFNTTACHQLNSNETMTIAASFPRTRYVYQWPFARDSIWNTPIGSNAQYVSAGIDAATQKGMTADEDVIVLTPDAPLTPVYKNNVGWSDSTSGARCTIQGDKIAELPIPPDFLVKHRAGTPNMAAAILEPDGRTLHQSQPFHRCAVGKHATSKYIFPPANLYGDGIKGAHGGSGMSSLGGTIRLGELVPNGVIHHALKLNLYGNKYLAYNDDDTPGYRWPAIKADSYAAKQYGGLVPELEMGALLALKPDFDPNTLKTEPGKIIAKAFQDYGGYVVDDTAWDVYALETEISPEGRVLEEFRQKWGFKFTETSLEHPWSVDMRTIFTNLQVVDNNAPKTIGGGGKPRQPLAPPFGRQQPNKPQPRSDSVPQGQKVWQIMPLGDSHTEGNYPNGHHSYRGYLRKMLLESGYQVDFVGDRSQQAHGDLNPPDFDHAGHGGFTIGPDQSRFCSSCDTANIYDHLEEYLAEDPEVILLLIGINDMFPNDNRPVDPQAADEKLAGLVKRILEIKPDVKILISSLLQVKWTDGWSAYNDVNRKARMIGEEASNDQVYFVDLHSIELQDEDFQDAIHLGEKGARKIAAGWFKALVPILEEN